MPGKTVTAMLLGVTFAALAAGLTTAGSRGATHRTYTVAFVSGEGDSPRDLAIARGGRAAAKRLGVHYLLRGTAPYSDLVTVFQSLVSQHVDAVASEGYEPDLKPILTKVRKAGIVLIGSGDDIAAKRQLWVSHTAPAAYAEALADALASQIKGRGEYAIVRQPGQFPIANKWQNLVQAYVAKAYPNMHLDGIIEGSDINGMPEPALIEQFMTAHPNLVGFISIVPRSAYAVAMAITQAGKIGKVFSAGNGGGDFTAPLPGWVRSGATEFVFASDPRKLGYLTVWAADYLVSGHKFKPGAYQVGEPIGLVRYYAKHQELRLGQPLTVTKANASRYANKF
jgi:rhamnose transport system substrate-binding protein